MLQVEHSYSQCGHIIESSAGGIQGESKSPPTSKVDPHPRFAHCILLDSSSFEANMEQITSVNPIRLQNMRRKALPSLISREIHEIFKENDTVCASKERFPGQFCIHKCVLNSRSSTSIQSLFSSYQYTWTQDATGKGNIFWFQG
jgi:hypothetical protein